MDAVGRASILVAVESDGARLVDFARAHLASVIASAVGPLIARGAIARCGHTGRMDERVATGDVITVDLGAIARGDAIAPGGEPLVIAYEDDDLIVVDKPPGMHVHPLGTYRTGTLVNALLAHAGARPESPWASWRPHIVHRLDRCASGLLLVAKRAAIHETLRTALEAHRIARRYEATVHGLVDAEAGTIDAPLGRDPARDYRRAVVTDGQPAVTHYRVLARSPAPPASTQATTRVELTLETGRTHQLRAHLAHIDHPIVGDRLYGSPLDTGLAIALRAVMLDLLHPRTGGPLHLEAAPPDAALPGSPGRRIAPPER